MTSADSNQRLPHALIEEVAVTGRSNAEIFETAFGVLRTLRRDLGTTGTMVADQIAARRANAVQLRDMATGGALERLQTALSAPDIVALDPTETVRMKADIGDLINRATGIEPAKAAPQSMLLRHTNRPLTRIASAMQARDQLDQRIAHIVDGFELIQTRHLGFKHDPSLILIAQVRSIGESLGEIVGTALSEIVALSEAFDGLFTAVPTDTDGTVDFSGAIFRDISALAARAPDIAQDIAAIASEWASGSTEQDSETDGLAAAKARASLDKHIDDLRDSFDTLQIRAERWSEIAEELEVYAEVAGEPSDGAETIDLLKALYTCDIEHSVHASATERL